MGDVAVEPLDRSGKTDLRPEDFAYPEHEVLSCPYPFYTAIRRDAPVYKVPGREDYLISRYEDVQWALKAHEYLSNGRTYAKDTDPKMAAIAAEQRYEVVPAVVDTDPPLHKKRRAYLFRVFTPAQLRKYEPRITRLVDDLIDSFEDRGSVEFGSEFAIQLPIRVLCALLGIEDSMVPTIKSWAEAFNEALAQFDSEENRLRFRRTVVDFYNFVGDFVNDKMQNPGEDILSELLASKYEDGSDPEPIVVTNMVRNLLVAGHETTSSLLANGMYLMVVHPGHEQMLAADHKLIPRFLEECLRVESPVQWAPRVAIKEFTLNGVTVPKGARVLVLTGAANRDGSRFPDADAFDPTRRNIKDHVAFGAGIHSCLGAPLARLEGQISFERLLTRLKNFRFDPEGEPVPYGAAMTLRFTRLPLLFDRA